MGTAQAMHDGQIDVEALGSMRSSTPLKDIVAALQRVAVLDGLTLAEYEWLAKNGQERFLPDGALAFRHNQPAVTLTFLLTGEIHVRRSQGGPIAFFIGRSGQMTGKLPFSRMKGYGGDGYAAGEVWALDIHESRFPELLAAIPSMAQRSVSVLLDRTREVTRIEQQSEKLNALGKLSANLSHELNNPASAARSAATSLWTELRNYGDYKYRLGALCFSPETQQQYRAWVNEIRGLFDGGSGVVEHDGGALAAREDEFTQWLNAHDVPDSFSLAPVLAETRIDIAHLDRLVAFLPKEALSTSISAFTSALKAERMTDAVIESTARIFDLITAIKAYSFMDQAPIQEVDIPQTLETTLTMLNSRLAGVEVERDFDPETPVILAYGSELNQVWTELIENALDAVEALPGTLTKRIRLRTAPSGATVVVEVWDNGPGIPEAIQSRIFEPFFTTKAVGAALGLGLDVVNRVVTKHRGQFSVKSKPGETCFQVRLPIEQTGAY